MKQYIKSICILIVGLSFFHLFSTIQVYLSNIDLFHTLESVRNTGYLLMPNKFIMEKLKDISVACAGGVFFTLSVGTFTVLVSFLAAVLYFRTTTIKKYAMAVIAVVVSGLVISVNYRGLCLVETLSFLFVPAAVFFLYKVLLSEDSEKPKPILLATHFVPVFILAVFLLIATINSSNKIFLDFRDNILMSNKAGMVINDFYYNYTLYPARVFKPYLQRTPKVCAIETEKMSADVKRIEHRLLQNDYLVVDKTEKPDFILRKDQRDLSLIYKGKLIIETTAPIFSSKATTLLKEFSQKTDKYHFYRQITALSLKTGFPLFMYTLMHFVFFTFGHIVFSTFTQKNKAAWFASLCCLTIGALTFLFIFSSENYEVSEETLPQILQSENVKERIAGLRLIANKKLDISRYATYDTSFADNSVPEKYWFARSLENSSDSVSYNTLIKFLDDPNQNVVCQALYSLGAKRKKETITIIIDHIKTSKDWYAQWYAYRALKRLRWKQKK